LNEQEIARREARVNRDREIAAQLDAIGVSRSEASLFNVIHYGLVLRPSDLCYRASFRDYSVGEPCSEAENEDALTGCLTKGWLQWIDEAALSRIQDEIRQSGLIGPIYGYPSNGGFDFTHAGAEQWFRICETLWDSRTKKPFAFSETVHEKKSYYFLSESKACAELNRMKESENVVSVMGPFPIGPWRAHWWRLNTSGYRIDVERRMPWEGWGTGDDGAMYFDPTELSMDLVHARGVLDRHNVQWAEWLVLATMEDSTYDDQIVREAVALSKRFDNELTEAECENGLRACLHYGWLRPVNEQTIAEIRSLLSADSASMPVPFEPTVGQYEVDFSVSGAELYRMLSTEILGLCWEDCLSVENSYYREEHYYCATEAGLIPVPHAYGMSKRTPSSNRIVPIGPWCVWWWERYRSGFRSEITYGEL
jgi:hypothetical protein